MCQEGVYVYHITQQSQEHRGKIWYQPLCFINMIELTWELNEMLQLSKRKGWNVLGTKEVFWVNTSLLSYSKTVKTDTEK